MDAESLSVILRLLSEDLNSITAETKAKGKGRLGSVSDAEIAQRLFLDEVTKSSALVADHVMAKSIAQAVESDSTVLAQVAASERQAANDHALACRVAGVRNRSSAPTSAAVRKVNDVSDALLKHLSTLNMSDKPFLDDDEEDRCPAGPSTWPSERKKDKLETKRCEACQEDHATDKITKVACGHCYCQECLQELFTASMTDESLFPPRCCRQPIPCETFERILGPDLKPQYQLRKEEADSQHRVYCAQAECNKYVPKASIVGNIATCLCKAETCIRCKTPKHEGECSEDESDQIVKELAKEQGWQQCFSCKRVVELTIGCNHITCLCGAQFCYLCGVKWKQCKCVQWQEDNLFIRAERIVGRAFPGGDIPENAVADMVDDLRRNHQCGHNSWTRVPGPHRCEECHDRLREYIMECRRCHLQACRRCTLNRL